MQILHKINVARIIVTHLIGEKHTDAHRRIVGAVIMVVGVLLTRILEHTGNVFVSIGGDVVGTGIHAIGLIPFISKIEEII